MHPYSESLVAAKLLAVLEALMLLAMSATSLLQAIMSVVGVIVVSTSSAMAKLLVASMASLLLNGGGTGMSIVGGGGNGGGTDMSIAGSGVIQKIACSYWPECWSRFVEEFEMVMLVVELDSLSGIWRLQRRRATNYEQWIFYVVAVVR
ncbi:Hypothetical predicted protein [Olea europaea subsp. europaea]|uniref:Uncharacterized protein n=1 Tax=Olea europaea subsp. europaea TaxID=158383 RepID=A0A8S0QTS4_OLEEU|nr:Hypothetical predicted protein [Olea europaea subsp. europaea]